MKNYYIKNRIHKRDLCHIRLVKSIFAFAIAVVLLCNAAVVSNHNTFYVSAAKKSTGSKNMTGTVKVKSKKGRDMTEKEKGALSDSSFKLLSSVTSKSEGKNVLISPTSIMYAFGMAENGAKGKTRSQLESVVNGGIKTGDFNKILAYSRNRMNKNKNVKWNIANSVWYRKNKNVKVKKPFLKNVKSYYGAEVYRAPFNSKTVKDVNSWVKKNTRKMIPKILGQTNKSDVMYLINAVAFEGKWAEQFTDRQILEKQDFTNYDKTVSKVTMLSGTESSYFELNGARGFKKSYVGGEYSFVGIEMPEGMTAEQYVKNLSENGGDFVNALNNMKHANVIIKFPEFKSEYNVELSNVLKGLGATNAFDPDKANLYNMFEKDPDSNYCFSAVLHRTYIEVDDKGTKAAAATAIVVNKATSVIAHDMEKIEITLDHPFVYAIVDNTNNLPVFIGVENVISEK